MGWVGEEGHRNADCPSARPSGRRESQNGYHGRHSSPARKCKGPPARPSELLGATNQVLEDGVHGEKSLQDLQELPAVAKEIGR